MGSNKYNGTNIQCHKFQNVRGTIWKTQETTYIL